MTHTEQFTTMPSGLTIVEWCSVPPLAPPPPPKLYTTEQVQDAIRKSGGFRTTLGVNGFTCECCGRSFTNAANYSGGVWIRSEDGNLSNHVLICNDCSEAYYS